MSSAADLRARAAKCRSLARRAVDQQLASNLLSLAAEYDCDAERAEMNGAPRPSPTPTPTPQ